MDNDFYSVDESDGSVDVKVVRNGPDLSMTSFVLFATQQLYPASARCKNPWNTQYVLWAFWSSSEIMWYINHRKEKSVKIKTFNLKYLILEKLLDLKFSIIITIGLGSSLHQILKTSNYIICKVWLISKVKTEWSGYIRFRVDDDDPTEL